MFADTSFSDAPLASTAGAAASGGSSTALTSVTGHVVSTGYTATLNQTTGGGTVAVYGFDFDTAVGLVFGDLAGVLTGLTRQTSVAMAVRAYAVGTGALVASSGTLTTGATTGRLPRWTHASLAATTEYHLLFVRGSDGEVATAKLTTT